MEKINIFDLKFEQNFRTEFYQLCDEVFNEAYLTNHTMVKKFESSFSGWTGCQYNVAVNNGTSALTAALMSLQLPKGSEVIIPTNTFIACWYAALQAGLKPVLIDIDSSFVGINLEEFESKITSQTRALVVTHIGGIISEQLPIIKKLCTEKKIYLVEDCAHAHGSSLNGVNAGAWGDVACFSFHLTKTITAGEGGLVCTSSENIYKNLISIRQFGMSPTNPHVFTQFGLNLKMSELIAAFLLVELKRAPQRIERRQYIASYYQSNLQKTKWAIIKPTQFKDSGFYKTICIGSEKRDRIEAYFKLNNIILPNGVYYTPLHRQPVVQSYYTEILNFKNADHFSDYHFCLPCYPELTDAQLQFVNNTLLNFELE